MSSPLVLVGSGSATLPLRAYPRRALALSGSAQHLDRAEADSRTLSPGNVDFWAACWFYPTTAAGFRSLGGRYNAGAANGREWRMTLASPANALALFVSSDGAAFTSLTSSAGATLDAWNFGMVAHRAGVGLDVRLNAGAWEHLAYTSGVASNLARFRLGAGATNGVADMFLAGRIDQFAFGASPPGGLLGVRDAIYDGLRNGGKGRRYEDLGGTQKTDWGLVSYWQFDERTIGTAADSHGTNHLTPNGSPTVAIGVT